MANSSIMNAGWSRGGFVPPSAQNGMPMWPDSLSQPYRLIFNFDWLSGGRLLPFAQQPFVERERGMRDLGGIYEHCIIAFDPHDASSVVQRLLDLGASNAPAPLEPRGFNVTVQSGLFQSEAQHWIEMYDPYRFGRVRLEIDEFGSLADRLIGAAEAELQALMNEVSPKVKAGDKDVQRLYQRLLSYDGWHLVSKSLVLSSFFSGKRLPLSTIMQALIWLPTFRTAYTCVSELPDDGSADQLPMDKLALLYGEEDTASGL